MITFHITDTAKPFEPEIRFALQLWALNQSQKIAFISNADSAFSIGTGSGVNLRISKHFTGPTAACRMHPYVQFDGT
jgi:hypothetical protein